MDNETTGRFEGRLSTSALTDKHHVWMSGADRGSISRSLDKAGNKSQLSVVDRFKGMRSLTNNKNFNHLMADRGFGFVLACQIFRMKTHYTLNQLVGQGLDTELSEYPPLSVNL